MSRPVATYRLQFRGGMDFARAERIVPYLARLGVSHLYASPIFTAEAGSTHGYDVVDCNEIDPALGGRAGFERLCRTLREHGLAVVLDIVPNHMAASTANRWWADVLEYGRRSRYAGHFDIDWSERLTLPVLGAPFETVLAAGELWLEHGGAADAWSLAYFDQRFPLDPATVAPLAGLTGGALEDRELIARVHEAQNWQLTFWKEARRHLSYRRFFEVTGLVGVRVEDPAVFEATHELVFDLLAQGLVDGLRVDHVDGLADPAGYLQRLRARIGSDTYLVVEKILEGSERLPPDWPVDGTTGYEFISAMANAFVDREGVARLAEGFSAARGTPFDAAAEMRAAKEQMIRINFEGETRRIARLASGLTGLDPDRLFEAIAEILIAFPVYRTYGNEAGMSAGDKALLQAVREKAVQHAAAREIDAIVDLVAKGKGSEFQTRFQQLTGPIMAKSLEDTLFYRDHRLIALNEVGGDPEDGLAASAERAHEALRRLVASQPAGMRATATHDTKRGEDARARLYALSEMPDAWIAAVDEWTRRHGGPVGASMQWLVYQALLGVWPASAAPGAEALESLRERFLAYLEKAMREAKQETSWTEPDEAFEASVRAFAEGLLAPASAAFHAELTEIASRLDLAGRMNGLAQTAIKLAMPGVPDIYQGSELFDDSLVDPDNRRPIDFDALGRLLDDEPVTWANWRAVNAKQRLVRRLLSLRRKGQDEEASYMPLAAAGANARHCLAFETRAGGRRAVVAVPRFSLDLVDASGACRQGAWKDTFLPLEMTGPVRDVASGHAFHAGPEMPLEEIFAGGPVAILVER